MNLFGNFLNQIGFKSSKKRKRNDMKKVESEHPSKKRKLILEKDEKIHEDEIIPKIKCDVSLVKNEKYNVEQKLPLHKGIYDQKYSNHPEFQRYKKNLDFFERKKKGINERFGGVWYAIWDCDMLSGKLKYKVGRDVSDVVFGSSNDSVISFGCNQDVVYLREEEEDFLTGLNSEENTDI